MTRTSLAKVTEGLLVRMVAMTVWVGRIGSMAGKKGSESVDGMQRDNVNVVCWIKDRLPDFCHNLCSKIAFENRIPVLLVVCDVIKALRKASMIQYDIFKLSAVTDRENLPDLLYISRSQQRIFFYLGFLSRTFTIHRTAGKGGIYLTPLFYFQLFGFN